MHTLFLLVAYLFSATLATPVAQLFDLFEDDPAATINNEKGIQNFPQDFGTEGLQKAVVNDAPPFLTGDATTNYLQAQLPSQDIFSNFGGGCPSGELFCCRGGSGPPGSLITDDAFNEKCIPYNDENTGDEKCQLVSNGSCCQPSFAAGATKLWQCVSAPIKVVPVEQEPDSESQTFNDNPDDSKSPGQDRFIIPPKPLHHRKGNWESL